MKVNLKFDNTVTRLAGFNLGIETYIEQVGNQYSGEGKLLVVFPNCISKVATSFVQGFFSVLVNEKGFDFVRSNIEVQASSPKLINEIWARLY